MWPVFRAEVAAGNALAFASGCVEVGLIASAFLLVALAFASEWVEIGKSGGAGDLTGITFAVTIISTEMRLRVDAFMFNGNALTLASFWVEVRLSFLANGNQNRVAFALAGSCIKVGSCTRAGLGIATAHASISIKIGSCSSTLELGVVALTFAFFAVEVRSVRWAGVSVNIAFTFASFAIEGEVSLTVNLARIALADATILVEVRFRFSASNCIFVTVALAVFVVKVRLVLAAVQHSGIAFAGAGLMVEVRLFNRAWMSVCVALA